MKGENAITTSSNPVREPDAARGLCISAGHPTTSRGTRLPNLLWEVANEASGGGTVDPAFAQALG